jgi:transcriptional/translational regulatory protein YebC/TACO1
LGVSFVIEALTDNSNRTVKLVKAAFHKFGGNMTSVAHMFQRYGIVMVSPGKTDSSSIQMTSEKLFEDAIESSAEDILENPEDATKFEVCSLPIYQFRSLIRKF